MNEQAKQIKYDTPIATEADLGPDMLLVTCNHGYSRSKELAYTARTLLAELGSSKKVCLLKEGWTGVVNSMRQFDKENSPARIFFQHLEAGGYLLVASHDAYEFFVDILKAKLKSHLISQVILIDPYLTKDELKPMLAGINFI